MKSYSSIVIIIAFLLSYVTGCTHIPKTPAEQPLKAMQTFDQYYLEGKTKFEAENYQEAVRYLAEAIKLDPNNQQVHALAGVAYTKLGMWSEARREFEFTLQINKNSPEGQQAQGWLERLGQPINILVLPMTFNYSNQNEERRMRIVGDNSFKILINYLNGSGLYNVKTFSVGSDKDSLLKQACAEGNLLPMCNLAKENGIKLIVSGRIDNFDIKKGIRPTFSDIGRIVAKGYKPPPEGALYLTGTIKVTVKVLATKDCRIVHSVTDQKTFGNVYEGEIDEALHRTLDVMFQNMFKEINARII